MKNFPKNFPKNFVWGCATSCYQVEGASRVGGRSDSIWDTFCRTPGKVYAGENGDVSVDQYHRYKEDVALMKELGIDYYRFSIAWTRILPDGIKGAKGRANHLGIAYYDRLIDCLIENGIKPAPTLFHWDLPQILQDRGGWANRETSYHFGDYAAELYKAFGDRVDLWITMNEPWCAAFLGHLYGEHAPGIKNRKVAYQALHHLNLAHGLSVQAFRSARTKNKAKIGIAHNLFAPVSASDDPRDIEAADRAADRDSRMFLNPLKGLPYPERHLSAWNIKIDIKSEDKAIMASPIDFLGINYYKEDIARHNPKHPEKFSLSDHRGVPISEMGWSVTPEGLTRLLKFAHREMKKLNLDIYVTENGYAAPDKVTRGHVHDPDRIYYLNGHLDACLQAIAEEVPLKGYFAWSFIDNFEWAFGYTKRFGIVYCDYRTLKRIPKDSFYFYKKVIGK